MAEQKKLNADEKKIPLLLENQFSFSAGQEDVLSFLPQLLGW